MLFFGNYIHLSIDTFLVSFVLFRSYVIFKLVKNINTYATDRSKRITLFFGITDTYRFLYKSNMSYNTPLTILILTTFIVLLFTSIFKLFEDEDPDYTSFENSLFYILGTMITSIYIFNIVGYGYQDTPKTLIGRGIAGISSILGLFILSLLIYYVHMSLQLSQWENGAFQDIENLASKKKQETRDYFKTYTAYKMSKLLNCVSINNLITRSNNFRKSLYIRSHIVNTLIAKNTPLETCENIISIWYNSNVTTMKRMQFIITRLYPQMDYFAKNTSKLIAASRESRELMFKLYNAFKIYTIFQGGFEIEGKIYIKLDLDSINGEVIISQDDWKTGMCEFFVTFYERRIKKKRVTVKRLSVNPSLFLQIGMFENNFNDRSFFFDDEYDQNKNNYHNSDSSSSSSGLEI
jgi:hypothetical protein